MHPEADATLTVDLSEWIDGTPLDLDIMVTCTVVTVDPAADPVTTMLECDDRGTPRGLGFTIPAADDPVAWVEGESLELDLHFYPSNIRSYEHREELTLHRATDGALLLVSTDGNASTPGIFAPVLWSIDRERCQPPSPTDPDAAWPMVLSFDNGEGEVVELGHQQRGTLTPPTAEGIFAIDVAHSIYANCCHKQDGWRNVLLRRTTG